MGEAVKVPENPSRTNNCLPRGALPCTPAGGARRRLALWTGCVMLVCCSDPREVEAPLVCPNFEAEIQPLLNENCVECHGGTDPSGNYSLESLPQLLQRDIRGRSRVEAGTPQAIALQNARGRGEHPQMPEGVIATLEQWIVDCHLRIVGDGLTHPLEWNDPSSAAFHGVTLQERAWSFSSCVECHGEIDDPQGGLVELSCLRCHPDTPTTCGTCHGIGEDPLSFSAPPPDLENNISRQARGVGAHLPHMRTDPILTAEVECRDCHVVPEDWLDPGHIFDEEGNLDEGPAEVVFGEAAARDLEGLEERRTAEPAYDQATGTCTNVYCHGGPLLGSNETDPPVWTQQRPEEVCELCHGMPPADTHAEELEEDDCIECHELVLRAPEEEGESFELINPELHIDGALTLGNGSGDCTACHGSTNPAPPPAVEGETSTSSPSVGLHQVHVSKGAFHGGFSCNVCHDALEGDSFLAAVIDEGHIDTWLPAEVFPGGADFPGIGAADGADPQYTFEEATCSMVYCHGGGETYGQDTSPGIIRDLSWVTPVTANIECGSCHGIPPQVEDHPVGFTINECYFCHPLTVSPEGEIRFFRDDVTTHINGEINL